ncbi:MAG: OmpA family protein, partial [Thermodesulfobacteriota bacterium]
GCALFGKQPTVEPIPLDAAVKQMTDEVIGYISKDGSAPSKKTVLVAIEPFVDGNSRQVPQVSRELERLMIQYGNRKNEEVRFARLSPDNLAEIDYLVTGSIGLERLSETEIDRDRFYHLQAELRNLQKVQIVGSADAWVSNRNLDFSPIPAYRDNPFYAQVRPADMHDEPQSLVPAPTESRDESLDLTTRALLTEAERVYGEGDYEKALSLFRKARETEGGGDFRTWAGIYMTNQKLGRQAAAEKAFGRLVAISVEQYDALTVKFLFAVNSAEFRKEAGLQSKYDLWLRQIGRYFQGTDRCLKIVGHSSRTGGEDWNRELSFKRAKNIQEMLKPSFPNVKQRSEAVGKGFSENIVGTGTDDERDALDRRVEIIPIDCEDL